MLHFFKGRQSDATAGAGRTALLGRLESAVMEILWDKGESRVQAVVDALDRGLAYTTVMTTLDRLFKKGLLDRTKQNRAFIYRAKLSRVEWERRRASDLVGGYLTGPGQSRELLLSCFLEAVGDHDARLLDEMEKEIRRKRRELSRRSAP